MNEQFKEIVAEWDDGYGAVTTHVRSMDELAELIAKRGAPDRLEVVTSAGLYLYQ